MELSVTEMLCHWQSTVCLLAEPRKLLAQQRPKLLHPQTGFKVLQTLSWCREQQSQCQVRSFAHICGCLHCGCWAHPVLRLPQCLTEGRVKVAGKCALFLYTKRNNSAGWSVLVLFSCYSPRVKSAVQGALAAATGPQTPFLVQSSPSRSAELNLWVQSLVRVLLNHAQNQQGDAESWMLTWESAQTCRKSTGKSLQILFFHLHWFLSGLWRPWLKYECRHQTWVPALIKL